MNKTLANGKFSITLETTKTEAKISFLIGETPFCFTTKDKGDIEFLEDTFTNEDILKGIYRGRLGFVQHNRANDKDYDEYFFSLSFGKRGFTVAVQLFNRDMYAECYCEGIKPRKTDYMENFFKENLFYKDLK